mmetsp:Transcript_19475/g.38716  ORF Transcript_19475/g.38716 Transcript_19475/m.38716 type:complete len:207 (-) Transcript_19475:52-672(-)
MQIRKIFYVAVAALVGFVSSSSQVKTRNYNVCSSGCVTWYDGCNHCDCSEVDPNSSRGLCPKSIKGRGGDDPAKNVCYSRPGNGRAATGQKWVKARCQKLRFTGCDGNFQIFSRTKKNWCCLWQHRQCDDKYPDSEGRGTIPEGRLTEMCHRQRCNKGFECNLSCDSLNKVTWCKNNGLECDNSKNARPAITRRTRTPTPGPRGLS